MRRPTGVQMRFRSYARSLRPADLPFVIGCCAMRVARLSPELTGRVVCDAAYFVAAKLRFALGCLHDEQARAGAEALAHLSGLWATRCLEQVKVERRDDAVRDGAWWRSRYRVAAAILEGMGCPGDVALEICAPAEYNFTPRSGRRSAR